jgi:hypothetical protein
VVPKLADIKDDDACALAHEFLGTGDGGVSEPREALQPTSACPEPAADGRAKGLALSPKLGLKAS